MLKQLPFSIDPYRLAAQGQFLKGRLALATMQRLASSLVNTAGDVLIELNFATDKDVQNRTVSIIKGSIRAALEVQCQRCLDAVTLQQEIAISLGLVRSLNDAEQLTSDYEPLVMAQTQHELLLSEFVEDELILSLPIVATHPQGECTLDVEGYYKKPEEEDQAAKEGHKPLAILGELLKK